MLTDFPAALCHPDSFKTHAGDESFVVAFDEVNSGLAFREILQIDSLQGKDSAVSFSAPQDSLETKDLFLSEQR